MTKPLPTHTPSFLTDATGLPIAELYQLLHDTAVDITIAVPDPNHWPNLLCYLIASMENQIPNHPDLEPALHKTSRLITSRLNTTKWQ